VKPSGSPDAIVLDLDRKLSALKPWTQTDLQPRIGWSAAKPCSIALAMLSATISASGMAASGPIRASSG
jgi:hypothetical protein